MCGATGLPAQKYNRLCAKRPYLNKATSTQHEGHYTPLQTSLTFGHTYFNITLMSTSPIVICATEFEIKSRDDRSFLLELIAASDLLLAGECIALNGRHMGGLQNRCATSVAEGFLPPALQPHARVSP